MLRVFKKTLFQSKILLHTRRYFRSTSIGSLTVINKTVIPKALPFFPRQVQAFLGLAQKVKPITVSLIIFPSLGGATRISIIDEILKKLDPTRIEAQQSVDIPHDGYSRGNTICGKSVRKRILMYKWRVPKKVIRWVFS